MKTLTLLSLMILTTLAVNAQDLKSSEVPANARTAFEKNYPQAKDIAWELKGSYYQVEFDLGKYDYEVTYDKNGKVVKLEKEVDPKELPSGITNAIKKKYPDYKIDKVEITQWGSKTSYEVEIEKGWNKERKLVFDGTAKLISDVED